MKLHLHRFVVKSQQQPQQQSHTKSRTISRYRPSNNDQGFFGVINSKKMNWERFFSMIQEKGLMGVFLTHMYSSIRLVVVFTKYIQMPNQNLMITFLNYIQWMNFMNFINGFPNGYLLNNETQTEIMMLPSTECLMLPSSSMEIQKCVVEDDNSESGTIVETCQVRQVIKDILNDGIGEQVIDVRQVGNKFRGGIQKSVVGIQEHQEGIQKYQAYHNKSLKDIQVTGIWNYPYVPGIVKFGNLDTMLSIHEHNEFNSIDQLIFWPEQRMIHEFVKKDPDKF